MWTRKVRHDTIITYIHTIQDGWTYLASVMNLFSKKIIGYSYSKTIDTDLAIKAVENACLNVRNTKGTIHSFSRKGNSYDNACIESFHSILKKEEVNNHKYYNSNVARKTIFEYIESWYNRKRIHGSIGYKTPEEVHLASRIAA